MTYHQNQLKLARLQVDMQYHAAFNYWGLKGVIAERWAHGPLFGAWTDMGGQVALTKAAPITGANVQGIYGLNAAAFNTEPVDNKDHVKKDVADWVGDVMDVLQPKRVTRLAVNWMALHRATDPEGVSAKLRARYYQEEKLVALLPNREFGDFHDAVEIFLHDGPKQTSIVLGVVGPPHRGMFFLSPDPERDSAWWLGIRVLTVILDEENGVQDPVAATQGLIDESYADLMNVVSHSFQALLS
jgi:hypothetical protein